MTITVRIITEELSPARFSAAFALYVGDNQLLPFETLQDTFNSWFSARATACDAAIEKINELKTAVFKFETETR